MENKEDRRSQVWKMSSSWSTSLTVTNKEKKKRSWASDVKGAIIFYRYLYIANVYADTLNFH